MRVSRQRRGGQGQSRARSNGTEPYLIACGMHDGAGCATAKVDGINCAQVPQPEGAREVVSIVLQGRRGRVGVIKDALGRCWAVDVRMQQEQARTVRSLKL